MRSARSWLIGKNATGVLGDVAKLEDLDRLYSAVRELKGRVDVVSQTDPAVTMLEKDGKVKLIAETRTPEGTQKLFGGPMPASSLYAPLEFIKKNPNTVQALTNATVRTLKWMQDASPQQILATVPEEYLLGNKAMYLFAYNNVKSAYSKDGYISEAGAKTTLKALASFNPNIKPGEEIVYDYGIDYLKNVIGRSHCQCSRCRKRRNRRAVELRAKRKRREARLAKQRKLARAAARRKRG